MAGLKVATIFGLLSAFFGLFVFGPWYGRMELQAALLAGLLAAAAWRGGLRSAGRSLLFVLPFVLSLLAFGAAFQWTGLMGRTDWLHDSLLKALVFPSSFLIVKLGLESITFRDILRLPLRPSARRNAIVLKAVMEKCTPLLHRYRFFMELTPHFDDAPDGSPQRRRALHRRFLRLCGVIVAAYISIYQQTEKTQELLDHRTRSFDYLARRNHVRNLRRKLMYDLHGYLPFPRIRRNAFLVPFIVYLYVTGSPRISRGSHSSTALSPVEQLMFVRSTARQVAPMRPITLVFAPLMRTVGE